MRVLQQFDPHVVIQPLSNGTCVKVFETHSRVFRNLTSKPRGNTQVSRAAAVGERRRGCWLPATLQLADRCGPRPEGTAKCWKRHLQPRSTAALSSTVMHASAACLSPPPTRPPHPLHPPPQQAVFVPSTFSGEPRDFYLGVVHAESNRAYQNYFYKMQVGLLPS